MEATGPYHTNCETSNFGCPFYAEPQSDIFSGVQLDVCLPLRVATLQEQIYYKSALECPSTSCGSPTTSTFEIGNLKALYKLTYYLSVKLYSASTQQLTVQLIEGSEVVGESGVAVDAT